MVQHILNIIQKIEKKLKPAKTWRDSLRANTATVLGGILAWSKACNAEYSGEKREADGLVASQVDLIAANGAINSLKALAQNEDAVASKLVMEGSKQRPNHLFGHSEVHKFGQNQRQVTVLLDPVDGTTNLRDGRVFNVATTAATSRPLSIDTEPTFNDVVVASTSFLALSTNFKVVISAIIATPTHLWELQINPQDSRVLHLDLLDTKPRKIREVVFANYYVIDHKLTKIETNIVKAGYPIVPGCGSSALDCLRILQLEEGAYIDLRARLKNPRAQLQTYDIAAAPFLAAAFAKATNSNISIYSADSGQEILRSNHILGLPLRTVPISFLLSKNIDTEFILDIL